MSLKYNTLAGEEAFLCGGALTAWIGSYLTSDYDFFFPDLGAAQRFHERLLKMNATVEGYQDNEDGQEIFEAIQSCIGGRIGSERHAGWTRHGGHT